VGKHKQGKGSEFFRRYKIDRLVYYESFDEVIRAINREKQIKGLLSIKKIPLIVEMNPTWRERGMVRAASAPARRIHRSFASLRMTVDDLIRIQSQ
jgi:hypothetical protein